MALKKFEEKEGREEGSLDGDKILKLHDAPPIKHTLSHKLPFSSSFVTEFGTGSHLCSGRAWEDTIKNLGEEAAGDKGGRAGTSEYCSRQNCIPSLGRKVNKRREGGYNHIFRKSKKPPGTKDFLEAGEGSNP